MSETENPFALSPDEEREFAALSGSEASNEADDFDEVAVRDADSAADVAEAEEKSADPDAEWRSKRRVPVEALIEHRVKLREAEKQIAERDRQFAIAQERLNILMASVQGSEQQAQPQYQQPEPEPIPDPEQDIFAFAKWQKDQIDRLQSQVQQVAGQTEQQQRAAWEYQQRQQLAQRVIQEEQQFSAEKPDYTDAVEFVRSRRITAYEQLGMPRAQAEATVNNEALNFVSQIAQSGRPIAQTVYEFAMQNGYTPGQARAAAAQAQPRDETGRFQPAQSEKLATVANAQARNKSLSSSNGSSGKKDLSIAELASMSDKEFHALIKKDEENGNALFKKALGYA
jgi:hypothetical protein